MRAAPAGVSPAALAVALALAVVAALALRTGAIDAGYWIDEGIAIGIASHELLDIPATLRQDGSPPLYYLLLHGWIELVGTGEAATRALSALFAVLAVPAALWAGTVCSGPRAGRLAAAGAAGCPFLTYYAQETRMYSLVAVLSLVACAAFVLAFVHDRRRYALLCGASVAALLYTHNWALFLALGMLVAGVRECRAGRAHAATGAWTVAAVAVLYAPWLPSLAFQAAHTGAPWAMRPTPLHVLAIPGGLFGYAAAPLLIFAVVRALRHAPPPDAATRSLAIVAAVAVGAAFASGLIEPAWSTRYTAVLLGPVLLAFAAVLARGTRSTVVALAGVAAIWLLLGGPPSAKSNVRSVAARVAPAVRPGDLVVSTQPEQVPVLSRYLPAGVVYVTPLGVVPDPRVTDWRDGVARLRAGRAPRVLAPVVASLPPGRRVLLVTPVDGRWRSQAPWSRLVRVRTREWRAALRGDPRLRSLARAPRPPIRRRRSTVRVELFEVRPPHPPRLDGHGL